MSINKYDELYSEFLKSIADLHNSHLAWKRHRTKNNTILLRKNLSASRELMSLLRVEVREVQIEAEKRQRENFHKTKEERERERKGKKQHE